MRLFKKSQRIPLQEFGGLGHQFTFERIRTVLHDFDRPHLSPRLRWRICITRLQLLGFTDHLPRLTTCFFKQYLHLAPDHGRLRRLLLFAQKRLQPL